MCTQQTKHSILSHSTQDKTNSMKQKGQIDDDYDKNKDKAAFKSFRRTGEYSQRDCSNKKWLKENIKDKKVRDKSKNITDGKMKRIENSIKELKKKVNPSLNSKEYGVIKNNSNQQQHTSDIKNILSHDISKHKSDHGKASLYTHTNKYENLTKEIDNLNNNKQSYKNISQGSTITVKSPNVQSNNSAYSKFLTPNMKNENKPEKDSSISQYGPGATNISKKTYG